MLKIIWGEVLGSSNWGEDFKIMLKITWGEVSSPQVRPYELHARYRLHRSQNLQQNMRWKALAEIYPKHSFVPVSNLKILVRNC